MGNLCCSSDEDQTRGNNVPAKVGTMDLLEKAEIIGYKKDDKSYVFNNSNIVVNIYNDSGKSSKSKELTNDYKEFKKNAE